MEDFMLVICIAPVFLILLTMGIVVWKTDFMYDYSRGGWKPGINLPHLFAQEGDEINHKGYKKYVGLTTALFGLLLTGYLYIFTVYLLKTEESLENEIVTGVLLGVGGMYILIFAFIYVLYGPVKERFIKRTSSHPPTYQRYIFALIISIFLIVIGSMYVEYLGVFDAGYASLVIIPVIIILIFFFIFKMFNYYKKEEYFKKLNLDINKFKRMIVKSLSLMFIILALSISVELLGWLSEGLASMIALVLTLLVVCYIFYCIIKMYKESKK
ncbi:hypothetical protein KHQ82_10510 [Mycoplasmatota bacterium]|nr:hypothetical protein KHQ82_10510 [Mycoplasmatota bacterium]